MTTQNKWLPCPFCGGTKLRSGGDDKTVMVWCEDCEATGPNGYAGKAEWNTRALSPLEPTEGQVEAGALALLQQRTHPPVKALGRDLASDHARSEATTVLLAARALPLQERGDQDISTAPKMTAIMIYSAGWHIGHFNITNNKWWTYTDGTGTSEEQILNGWGPPTRWRPLPPAPMVAEHGTEGK